ncbi:hypothetical protein LEP1GSC161_2832 [Leptospira santarosai str. CBC1416]|uniref:Uncharacterized protein n=1 Tax=Leptospira santarosai str. CBC1416 TaxID=1193059 RepID=M6VM81_9LEPT|nr:hypothetical protein LEP1GSC161_2832 [Leptospira santarosai str. CBC1416]
MKFVYDGSDSDLWEFLHSDRLRLSYAELTLITTNFLKKAKNQFFS